MYPYNGTLDVVTGTAPGSTSSEQANINTIIPLAAGALIAFIMAIFFAMGYNREKELAESASSLAQYGQD